MLLVLLLDPDLARLGPIILAGWGLFFGLPGLLIWSINELSKGDYGRARGILGLAVLALLLLIGWRWMVFAVAITLH